MNANYKGYQAYDYLEKGKDFKSVEPCAGDQRVEEYLIPLTPEQEKRLEKVRSENIFVALHDHPELLPADIPKDMEAYRKLGRRNIAYEALARSYYDTVIDSVGGTMAKTASNAGWKWEEAIHDMGMRLCDVAQQDFLVKCCTVEDIFKAKRDGKVGWVIGMESASCIENEIDRLDVLYGFGLRQIGITYSSSNSLASGGQDVCDGGLTSFGRKAVERMNRLGILIDCAHSSTQTILDVSAYSTKPIILSHIGARELYNIKRLATNDALKACADKGGLIGVEAAPHTTISPNHKKHSVYSVIEHFEYVRDLVGIDHVTFGTDTLYGDHVALHNASKGSIKAEKSEGMERVPYVRGMENPTEVSKNVVRYLVSADYSDEDIKKVLGGNVLRILQEVWK